MHKTIDASSHAAGGVTTFTSYQKLVLAVLAFLQFTIILDFMVLSPLGAILMPALQISTSQFGLVVSAYAFSAGASGFLAAGFADRFDRKKLLLFFYTGFLVGTLLCGIASSFHFLLVARVVTGVFGGVIGSIVFAIITDLYPFQMRGRVMGIIQTAFAASQVLGIPFSLYLANRWGWHSPFLLIVMIGLAAGLLIMFKIQPVNAHLKAKPDKKALHHLVHTISTPRYVQGFATTALLSIGGFMMMPFSSAFSVYNLGVKMDDLPLVYIGSGVASMVMGPLIGRISDRVGKLQTFLAGSLLTICVILVYTRLGLIPLAAVIGISVLMFVGINARMISSSALMSALPTQTDRGAYMAISSSLQYVSGGIGATVGGLIVVQSASGAIEHFDTLGNVVVASSLITAVMMVWISAHLKSRKTL